jgi:octaprenyl-diphosphate synthase
MAWTEAVAPRVEGQVLTRLSSICGSRGLDRLGSRLAALGELVADDMVSLEADVARLDAGDDVVGCSAAHLISQPGKRLRPMCVALAARVGKGLDARSRELAIAVELVHSATLLHDDVIDVGDVRRGAAAARTVWGNAASIFAGDWLLVEALRRVRRAGVAGTLDRLLEVVDEMIRAEAVQLERRGRVDTSRDGWLRVVSGKTAALFRWAMFAGARAGGLSDRECGALEAYGTELGIAFQAVDDLLDLTGDASVTGKALFTDLREGKMTWPLIVAAERDPAVRDELARIVALPPGLESAAGRESRERVLAALETTGAVRDCMELARARAACAVAELAVLPGGPAVDALATVAEAAVARQA